MTQAENNLHRTVAHHAALHTSLNAGPGDISAAQVKALTFAARAVAAMPANSIHELALKVAVVEREGFEMSDPALKAVIESIFADIKRLPAA